MVVGEDKQQLKQKLLALLGRGTMKSDEQQQAQRKRTLEMASLSDATAGVNTKRVRQGPEEFPNNCRVGFRTVDRHGKGIVKAIYPSPSTPGGYLLAVEPVKLVSLRQTPYDAYDLLILPTRSPLAALTGENDWVWRITAEDDTTTEEYANGGDDTTEADDSDELGSDAY
jgi:hypothetical protein